jgi:hypothetical protein
MDQAMTTFERQQDIHNILKNFRGRESLRTLIAELNYDYVGENLPMRSWSDALSEKIINAPNLFAAGGDREFHIIYTQLKDGKLLRGTEREVVNQLLKEHPYSLFVFSNKQQDQWHFVNVRYDADNKKRRLFRRIAVGADERLRTASERIAMLDLESINKNLLALSPLEIQTRHDEAFNVEAVTKQFFNEYKSVYAILQKDLTEQTKDGRWAHDYALQFLNRCMFLYFIQRKRWLGDDTEFLRNFWESYQRSNQKKDIFFADWLNVLFFEAFNNRKTLFNTSHRAYIPEHLREALHRAPFLNGGLFNENELDQISYDFNITDERFKQIFNFLEGYNFTITEDSPLDQEVAVDPEMIGKVYESLVNVSTEADERGDAGIFYTPRTEIDLMCRLALIDNLTNHLGAEHKNLLYEMVFALEPQEKQSADEAVAKADLWQKIDERIREITVVDPACGSGSFLVGMLYVLDDLQCRAAAQLKKSENAFERKKRIIGQSLYGVDVMDWAAHVAELRMWLALVIDAEFTTEELSICSEPFLPHFSFKIRCGDSLVQEIGGLSLANLRDLHASISPAMKARVTNLKNEKMKFYNNDPQRKFKSKHTLEQEELNLFRDILDERRINLEKDIRKLENQINHPLAEQIGLLTGTVEAKARQRDLKEIEYRTKLEELKANLEKVKSARETLKSVKDVPFVWDIAFVEVFTGENGGFDIVLGNPPYVRQENIAPPHEEREKITTEIKRAYKAKLQRAVYQAFPHFFGYNEKTGNAKHKLDAKSDLYIYFYFLTLSRLNQKGAFCFITSNSWLDVGYGADLQEFLLKRCHVKLVIDNSAKRSFESADVNTVITLLSPPTAKTHDTDATNPMLENTTRFVMLKTDFENVLSPIVFEEIEEANERKQTPEYCVFPISQKQLLEDGIEAISDEDEETTKKKTKRKTSAPLVKAAHYIGNKWGGKYLRAPEIFHTMLESGRDKLVPLGSIATIRFGLKSGANEFFYLENSEIDNWGLEPEFLRPVIISPRECQSVFVESSKLKHKAFICSASKSELKGTAALDYIKWGEEQGFHLRPSCKGRREWYQIPQREYAELLFPMIHNDRPAAYINKANVIVDHNLFEILTPDILAVWASLFWIGQIIFRELYGRSNLGQGALKTEGVDIARLPVVHPKHFNKKQLCIIENALGEIKKRKVESVGDECGTKENGTINFKPRKDRAALDNVLFDIIGLSEGERAEAYLTAYELVCLRLNKADSLKRITQS